MAQGPGRPKVLPQILQAPPAKLINFHVVAIEKEDGKAMLDPHSDSPRAIERRILYDWKQPCT